MLAKRLATILPPLTLEEALETTKIHSIVGLLAPGQALVTRRPFRAPHHTASDAGLLGGNINPTPGEISLAHHGVLFLDELPEFKRSVLETMRQPLEEGRVTISRAAGTMTFPVAIHAGGRDESDARRQNAGRIAAVRRARFRIISAASPARCWTASTCTSKCRR